MQHKIFTRHRANLPYDQLREAVKEAWETITVQQLDDLLDSMPDRMHAVIDAQGMYTVCMVINNKTALSLTYLTPVNRPMSNVGTSETYACNHSSLFLLGSFRLRMSRFNMYCTYRASFP